MFVVALLVGYFRPVLILVMFPFLLLYGGMWALGPLPAALAADVERTGARLERSTRDPMAELVRVQRFAVRAALAAGRDPDDPPHLSRSVVLP